MSSQIVFVQGGQPANPTNSPPSTALYAYTDGNLYILDPTGSPLQLQTAAGAGIASTQIAFGSASGPLAGSSTFTYTPATGDVVIGPPISGVALTVNEVIGNDGILVQAGSGSATDRSINVGWPGHYNLFNVYNDGHGTLGYNGTGDTLTWTAAGNVTIAAPSSGDALDIFHPNLVTSYGLKVTNPGTTTNADIGVVAASGQYAILSLAGNGTVAGTNDFAIFHNTNSEAYISNRGAFGLHLQTNSADRFVVNSAGNVIINAPTSGVALGINILTTGVGFNIQDSSGYGIYLAAENTLDFNYGINASSGGYINYYGYQAGSTQFRDLHICNGKGVDLMVFSGANQNVTIPAPATAVCPFFVNGPASTWTATYQASTTNGGSYGLLIFAGTVAADYAFLIDNAAQNANLFAVRGNGSLNIYQYANGSLTCSGGVMQTLSDERIKTNIRPFIKGIETISKLNPILHGWDKEKSGVDTPKDDFVGFSAQNVNDVMPEACDRDKEGYLSLSDRAIIAALVNGMKEQQAQIDLLLSKIAVLEAQQGK